MLYYNEIMTKKQSNIFSNNRRAVMEYNILKTYEAGIVLSGTEVKSVK
ncbi:MAG: SsrA-binding protein, partial [Candidatus Harrisonbacteria bacterium CG10_big_fil_rev_8_21_14_0_10_38_8]